MPSSDPPPVRNRATEVLRPKDLRLLPAATLEQAFARAKDRMMRVPPTTIGYRLFWTRMHEVGWIDLPVNGAFAVIGRHSLCDVVLHDRPEVSLRHLLATTVKLADGVGLRLVDLHTSVPFFLSDDTPRRSVVATGLLLVRLADYVIGGLPTEEDPARPGRLRFAPCEYADPEVVEAQELPPAPPPAQPQPDDSQSLSRSEMRASRVTSMPPSAHVSDFNRATFPPDAGLVPAPAAVEAFHRGPAPKSGPVVAQLSLQRQGREACVDLTSGELDLGVLVGRSDRCLDSGLHAVLDTHISRGHLLIMQHHGRVEAYDLCSTQGTWLDGRKVRRCELSPSGTRLQLASLEPISLYYHKVAS